MYVRTLRVPYVALGSQAKPRRSAEAVASRLKL